MKIEISKEIAKKLYHESQDWFKKLLEAEYGKDCFKKKDWHDIKTVQDACDLYGINLKDLINPSDTEDEIAYKKLKIIAKAINEEWVADWDNSNQYKWYPYFKLSSGFGFSTANFDYDCAHACVGSRLCFETKEKAEHAGKQFEEVYKDFLTISK